MKKSVKILWRLFWIGFISVALIIVLANFGVLGAMPSIEELQNPSASMSSQVYASDGSLMGKYYLQDRVNVKYPDISQHVINALIATEDERFYDHSGIDPRSLGRAIFSLGSEGGGSTITMQTAKNLFTEQPSNNIITRMLQKIKEGIIAIKLEKNFTKEEILTLYLNTVPFGDNVFGIRNASKTFFSVEPDRLKVEEAAVLVGMLKASTTYNPRINPKYASDRRNTVFEQMVRNNKMSEGEAAVLKSKPIKLNYNKLNEATGLAPYFRMVLGEELKKWCKEHQKQNGKNYNIYKDGLKIYTTIDPRMQLYAEEAVAKHMSYMQKLLVSQAYIKNGTVWNGHENILENAMKQSDRWKNQKAAGMNDVENRQTFSQKTRMKVFAWNSKREKDTTLTPMDSIKYSRQILHCGLMSMDPLTGHVKAWVGGIDFKNFKYDHVNINTKRQVGSTIKPLLYGLAIEDAGFTPNTIVVDQQQRFGGYGLVPNTSTSCTGGSMPMSAALAASRNCATAYIMKQLGSSGNEGPKKFVDFLKNCNVTTEVKPYPSIALGSCEISLYEMIQAYTIFPGRGFNVKPQYILRIEDNNGNVLQNFAPQRKEVISELTAYSVIDMMQGVVKFGTGKRIWSYGAKGAIAGKTGTTNDNSDAWFMGYTPQLLTGVWSGCDDRFIRFKSTAIGQGAAAALPVWGYYYSKVVNDKKLGYSDTVSFAKPEVSTNEINYDWVNNIRIDLGAAGEDMGSGDEADYTEGEMYAEENIPVDSDTNNTDPDKKQDPPAPRDADSSQKPKAIMPKKDGDGGLRRR